MIQFPETHTKFKMFDMVKKSKGAQWSGRVVGWYSTELTPEGYAVESNTEKNSVQIYPAFMLEFNGINEVILAFQLYRAYGEAKGWIRDSGKPMEPNLESTPAACQEAWLAVAKKSLMGGKD